MTQQRAASATTQYVRVACSLTRAHGTGKTHTTRSRTAHRPLDMAHSESVLKSLALCTPVRPGTRTPSQRQHSQVWRPTVRRCRMASGMRRLGLRRDNRVRARRRAASRNTRHLPLPNPMRVETRCKRVPHSRSWRGQIYEMRYGDGADGGLADTPASTAASCMP